MARLELTTSPAEPRMRTPRSAERLESLVVVHSPDTDAVGRKLELDRARVLSLGRGRSSHATIADLRLSRQHAKVAYDPIAQAFRIGDARSRNGTYVDGRLVDTEPLQGGSVIRIGDTLLVVVAEEAGGALAERIAQLAPTDLSVLLLGETGTGKEVQARRLHDLSGRVGKFIAVNCASIPRDVISAELFGHTRGAFSGAVKDRAGLFRAAAGGTILLDEIGDMPTDLQTALLRVLQEKKVRPVGSDQDVPVDARVVAATHALLDDGLENGSFRRDLFARLAQVIVRLPPLRRRRAEILALSQELARAHGRELLMSADAAEALLCGAWPHNVRELASLMAVFAATAPADAVLDSEFLLAHKPELFEDDSAVVLADRHDPGLSSRPEDLTAVLRQSGGKMAVAARRLGVSRQKLYRLLKAAGLDPAAFREDVP